MSRSYAELMGAIRYGYAPYYAVVVDGLPTVLLEVEGDAIAPSGYTLSPTLIVDSGARVGSVVNPQTNLGKGFDFEFWTLPGAMDVYMERPSASTALDDNINASTTTIPLASPSLVDGVSPLFMGLETLTNPNASTPDGLTGVTRGAFGRARSARTGVTVADRPTRWVGRKVTVYLLVVDPTGAYVQGVDILAGGCVVWTGYLAKRPVREAGQWAFRAVEQTKRLEDPFSAAAEGEIEVTLDDDALVEVDLAATIGVTVEHLLPGTGSAVGTVLAAVSFQPFRALSNPLRLSEMRQAIVDEWAVVTTGSTTVGELRWEQVTLPDLGVYRRGWRASIEVTAPAITGSIITKTTITGRTPMWEGAGLRGSVESEVGRYSLQLGFHTSVFRANLAVRLDSLADELPSPTGWVRLEGDGKSAVVRYTDAQADPIDGQVIRLTLEPNESLDLFDLATTEVEGEEPPSFSATFLWRAFGSVADVLRKVLASGGDATLGAYDTLGRGQGYSIEHLDADSFDEVFDGAFDALSVDIAQDAGDSLAEAFSGLLRLSGRGLASRRAADGSAVKVAAINVGSCDDGAPLVVLTDADLCDAGRAPVRPLTAYDAPQQIKVACKVTPDGTASRDSRSITLRSPHLSDHTTDVWSLDIYGIERTALYEPAKTWGLAAFRTGENRQVLELDIGPWHDVQPGDVIGVVLRDINAWDYASGAKGITSLARVLGVQLSLDKGFQVVTVMVDGIFATRPLCPSMQVLAFDGSATNPTWVEVSGDYFELCETIWAGGNDVCTVYQPGEDAGVSEYVFSAPTLVGGRTRLARVSSPSSPTVTLTTSHYLTWRRDGTASVGQRPYTHVNDGTQWS